MSGSLELEIFTGKDGTTTDKRLKILLDNWGFVPVVNKDVLEQPPSKLTAASAKIDGDREPLPG